MSGLTGRTIPVPIEKGRSLLIVVRQAGIDVHVHLTLGGRDLGTYESMTGRYGEDRVLLEVPADGSLQVRMEPTRVSSASGGYHLIVLSPDENALPADRLFTQASHLNPGRLPKQRVDDFEAAEAIYKMEHLPREEGLAALAALHLRYETMADSRTAISTGNRAIAALHTSGDELLQATAFSELAVLQGKASRDADMRNSFERARALFHKHRSAIGEAEVQLLAAVATYQGEDSEGLLNSFRELAERCGALHEPVCQALSLMNVAMMLRSRADYTGTFKTLYQSLALIDEHSDPLTFARITDNVASSLRMVGDFDGAIANHERALSTFKREGECTGELRSLYGLGYSLLGIGDDEQALRFYKLTLERHCAASQPAQLPQGSADALDVTRLCVLADNSRDLVPEDRDLASWSAWDLGNLARAKSDPAAALECHGMAGKLATSPNYKLGTDLERIRDLLDLQRQSEAHNVFTESQNALRATVPWYRAEGSEVGARLSAADGQYERALRGFRSAAVEYNDVENFEGEFAALARRASLGAATHQPRTAESFEDADAALENVRLLSLDPAFSASLFESGRRIYEEWIDYLTSLSAGDRQRTDSLDTLVISERSRARLLAQITKASRVGQEARDARLRSVAFGALETLNASEAGKAPAKNESASSTLDRALTLERALGISSAKFNGSARSASASALQGFQRKLRAGSTVVEYLIGERRSHAWVVTHDSIRRFDLSDAKVIRATATAVRDAIDAHSGEEETRLALGRLYDLLWRPIRSAVSGTDVLVIPDDVLHEMPFPAMWDPERKKYLVDQFAISYLPSIQFAMSRWRITATAASGALLVGDPVYEPDDARERCVRDIEEAQRPPVPRLRRLPASLLEVSDLEGRLRADKQSVALLTGCEATRARVLTAQLPTYRFIHFAAHAKADRVIPQRSALYLSNWDEKGHEVPSALTAADFLELPLKSELVVLSGCSTAGGKRFNGEGSLGLPFSIVAAGSRKVISTLWAVGDEPSRQAMANLYEGLIARHESAAVALRNAQRTMLHDPRWSHPRFWGAYSLLGT